MNSETVSAGRSVSTGRAALSAILAVSLAACGGGGGGGQNPVAGGGGGGGGGTPTPGPCAISNQIAFADDVLDEWYLFPNLLDNNVNAANFTTVQSFLDARVAPARAQSRDKGFTFATSIEQENALISSGASAGFGIRLAYDTANDRVFLFEAFENAPGFQAGMDRGTELLAIGTDTSNLQLVSSLMASGGPQAVVNALGSSDPGVSRVIRFRQTNGNVIERAIVKAEFSLDPISDRYGAVIIDDGGKNVGYLNFRTFFPSSAGGQLRDAFQLFNANGVDELIIDFRYNGGGLVSLANTFGDLLNDGRGGQVWSRTTLRASKASENETRLIQNEVQALAPTKIAFIGTGNTASASELVINSMLPYVDPANVALIGRNTSGKPVGQFAFDLADCDLRIRAVTFQTVNADDEGDYFNGLAGTMPNTCSATDDITQPLGDAQEDSIATALDFLAGRNCTAISGTADAGTQGSGQNAGQSASFTFGQDGAELVTLSGNEPSPAQREVPGLF